MKQRRKFSREYKVEAVRLGDQRGARAASESLGIDKSLIYQWKKLLEGEGPEAFRGNGTAQHSRKRTANCGSRIAASERRQTS